MATLEWGDTFDHYAKLLTTSFDQSLMAAKWTGQLVDATVNNQEVSASYSRPGARPAGGCRSVAPGGRFTYKTLPLGAQATRCISVWWNPSAANNVPGIPIIAFYDALAEQLSVRLDNTAHIVVSRNGTTLATSTNTISQNTWYHIQFKATIHNTTGSYEVRINGTSVGWIPQATGANTRGTGTNNSATQCLLGGAPGGWFYDDYLVSDDFPGPIAGVYVRPAAPGFYQNWTPNSGDNRAAVADGLPDGDASFIASSVSGNIDTSVMETLPAVAATILGIQHVIYAKQDAGAQRTLRPKQRSGSTDYNGASFNTGSSYAYDVQAVSINPATGVAWTKASFEAAEFGVENV